MTIDPAHQAPGRLAVVQSFVNTADRYGGHDRLAGPEQATGWLIEEKLMPAGPTIDPADLRALHRIRASLRDLAAANTDGHAPPATTVAAVNRAMAAHPSIVTLDVDTHGELHASLVPHRPGVASVVANLGAAVHEAVLERTWPRLKACANPDCRWLFFDTSRSRTGKWCSMAACGSILKARAYRRRRSTR